MKKFVELQKEDLRNVNGGKFWLIEKRPNIDTGEGAYLPITLVTLEERIYYFF